MLDNRPRILPTLDIKTKVLTSLLARLWVALKALDPSLIVICNSLRQLQYLGHRTARYTIILMDMLAWTSKNHQIHSSRSDGRRSNRNTYSHSLSDYRLQSLSIHPCQMQMRHSHPMVIKACRNPPKVFRSVYSQLSAVPALLEWIALVQPCRLFRTPPPRRRQAGFLC